MPPIRVLMVNARADALGTGISQYTDRLVAAFDAPGIAVERLEMADWGARGLATATRRLRAAKPDVVHIQWPMFAYGRSVVPQILALAARSVVTVHEASALGRFTGRAKLGAMLLRPRPVVFTNAFERDFVGGWAPWVRKRAVVIPIGSNIATVLPRTPIHGRVTTFGAVREGRGLEEYLALARVFAQQGGGWQLRIVGRDDHTGYGAALRRASAGLPVEWTGALDDAAIARELAEAEVACFPFPDGASERRGSLLAALAAGVPVISRAGAHTTPALRDVFAQANTAAEMADAISRLASNAEARDRLATAGLAYTAERTWPRIAEAHAAAYRELAGGK